MILTDVHCMLGEHYEPREGRFFQAEDVLEEMDFYGIERAIVYHGMAQEYDFEIGNRMITKAVQSFDRLIPCWVLGLHQNGRLDPPQPLIERAQKNGVPIFRLFFGSFISESVEIDLIAYEALFEVLNQHRLPVIIEYEHSFKMTPEQLPQLDRILENFPHIPLIMSSLCYDRLLLQLMPRLHRYSNLHITSCGLHQMGSIAFLCEQGYADRIVFGTGFPWFSGGMTKIALAYEQITGTHREMIACRNIERLIKRGGT